MVPQLVTCFSTACLQWESHSCQDLQPPHIHFYRAQALQTLFPTLERQIPVFYNHSQIRADAENFSCPTASMGGCPIGTNFLTGAKKPYTPHRVSVDMRVYDYCRCAGLTRRITLSTATAAASPAPVRAVARRTPTNTAAGSRWRARSSTAMARPCIVRSPIASRRQTRLWPTALTMSSTLCSIRT